MYRKYDFTIKFLIFILLLPVVVLLIWAFINSWTFGNLMPNNFGLRGWKYFFNFSSGGIEVLLNSILLSLSVTIASIALSLPAAKALTFYNFKGKQLLKILFMTPMLFPLISVAMGIHISFLKLGLANTWLGVFIVHIIPCTPYALKILMDVYEITGSQMELQARVLGANKVQTMFYITIPMLMPGILSAASMAFIVSFSQYFLTFLIGGGNVVTFSMMMFPFIQSGDRHLASVFSIIFIVTTLFILQLMETILKRIYLKR